MTDTSAVNCISKTNHTFPSFAHTLKQSLFLIYFTFIYLSIRLFSSHIRVIFADPERKRLYLERSLVWTLLLLFESMCKQE